MGGKVWSNEEEEVFWSVVARLAPPGLHQESKEVKKGQKKKNHKGAVEESWAPLVPVMVRLIREKCPGQPLRRQYTAVSLYEHYFQNFVQGKLSPNAGPHVEEYRAWLKASAENPESVSEAGGSDSSKSAESSSSESTVSDESPETESDTTLENPAPLSAIPLATMHQQPQQMQQMQQTQYMHPSARTSYNGQSRIGFGVPVPPFFSDPDFASSLPPPFNNPEYLCSLWDPYSDPKVIWYWLNVKGWSVDFILNDIRLKTIQRQQVSGSSGQADLVNFCSRTMNNDRHSTNVSARMDFQNHNGMSAVSSNPHSSFPAEKDVIGGGQCRPVLHTMPGPTHNSFAPVNMGACYDPITGPRGAENNASSSFGQHTVQGNYLTANGAGVAQNNASSFMGHDATQHNHSAVIG